MKLKKYICEERTITQGNTPLPVYDYECRDEWEFKDVVLNIKFRYTDELCIRKKRVCIKSLVDKIDNQKETAVIHYFSKYDEYITSVFIARDWSYHE